MRTRTAALSAAVALAAATLFVPRAAGPAVAIEGFVCDAAGCAFPIPVASVSIAERVLRARQRRRIRGARAAATLSQ